MTRKGGRRAAPLREGGSRWTRSDFPSVLLLVVLGAIPVGLVLARMAVGGNMKGQAMLAIAPWALAILVSARARRSSWTYSQRLIIHLVLATVVVAIWVAIFTQPREEFEQEATAPVAQWTVPPPPPPPSAGGLVLQPAGR